MAGSSCLTRQKPSRFAVKAEARGTDDVGRKLRIGKHRLNKLPAQLRR